MSSQFSQAAASTTNPLFGKKILNTRPAHQAGELTELLRAQAAEVYEVPMLEICSTVEVERLLEAVDDLRIGDWIAVTSANAVRVLFPEGIGDSEDMRVKSQWGKIHARLKDFRFAAVSEQTKRALLARNLKVDFVSKEANASGFGIQFVKYIRAQDEVEDIQKVLILHGALFEPGLLQALKTAEIPVQLAQVYETKLPDLTKEREAQLQKFFQALRVNQPRDGSGAGSRSGEHIVFLGSAQTARNCIQAVKQGLKLASDSEVQKLLGSCIVATIGPKTAETVQELGIQVSVIAQVVSTTGFVKALVDWCRANNAAQIK